jgi:DNA mismatch endonuclease (patch repair protein)
MADRLTPEARSALMSRIRGKDTKPELAVRRMLHAMGYRFRLHRKDLPGRPDIVFPGRRKVIFVHGCFWHGHEGCRLAARPSTRADFWAAKIDGNRARDARNLASLRDAGWEAHVLWECGIEGHHDTLAARVSAFLGAAGRANT